ncbi:hypothetical protein A2631_03280 [Candidatus Daviesbacteria bacterium RIFCSPHIGHO2_01_FULL_44_29]|uniref:histidine kinase n=1 Tax=Candidatus Daviesbacteria bacterium RIFCSPHIGHO2_02_FULL_43_12 TaxID=1797776 RepID=A0A1F5KKT2_9BACT|nr:MAG: hypothetical protein A2631_03280 [Candidatus Daviesbacteria bacterium RIFCSPHIGHO2_01_FULL_44_29]OGE40295.1 MAG: hypothetical protein A3E86_03800 [Candidatus Daviesbacteria bacterium RIFCSPHIGHO2_12_FULL_47_45]OGE41405.1 MAG: hypothetical protein A3D25_02675 [Candidatus Daviesbacteria bacterium RIFCSPHIGHO2_02_FULL_43_12]OGE69605.1 MAG: hypothetical protein A3B55_04420 [Candidatus Daviesbacteria bacterium RIFCSPLOWO2_01_FULL_43_15]
MPENDSPSIQDQKVLATSELPPDLFNQGSALKVTLRIKTLSLILLPLLILSGTVFYLFYLSNAKGLDFLGTTLFITTLLASVAGLIAWFSLSPLSKIYASIQAFRDGNLQKAIDVHSQDELGQISAVLNEMALGLNTKLANFSADQELSLTEKNKLNTILSALKDGIIVISPDKKVLLSNQEAEHLTGWTNPDMKDQSIDNILILSDRAGQAVDSTEYIPLAGKKEQTYESNQPLTLLNRAGAQVTVALSTTPVPSNSQIGFIISLKDSTRQKQLDSMQLDFVSMASHELRTPITSIRGYLSVFMHENEAKLNKEQKDFLDRMMISTQQLDTLVNNLLAVSKVERGAIAVSTQALDWGQTLTQTVQENQLHASEKNIKLNTEKISDLPKVMADSVRIGEVLNNLIGNAISYTQEGGRITVSSKVEGREMVTTIKDTGRGIDPETLPHLFSKFFRVQGALDKESNSKGTGLGLYLSKSIIDMHKGKIWAESPGLGQGSSFSFTLPLAEKVSVSESLASLDLPKAKIE